jgi:hypothetical protein
MCSARLGPRPTLAGAGAHVVRSSALLHLLATLEGADVHTLTVLTAELLLYAERACACGLFRLSPPSPFPPWHCRHGADVNVPDAKMGLTPLLYAVHLGTQHRSSATC